VKARRPYAPQINLILGNSPCYLMNLGGGAFSGNFTGQCLNIFRQSAIGKDGQAQPVAARIFCGVSFTASSLRLRACDRIRAIGVDLARADHAALLFLAGLVSMTLISVASICCAA